MPSTYTLNNGIELIGTGEQSGTWGDTTNTNLGLLDAALDGQVTITLAAAGSSGSPNALPITDGTASNGRNRMVVFADGADLGATAFVQLTPNDAEKIIYIRNSLSGSRSVILFQGTYNASNDYEVPAGTTAVVYFDGAGAGAVAANVFNNAHFDALNVVGAASIGSLVIAGTAVTATAAELNILDGVTATAAELNLLDGSIAGTVVNSKAVIYGAAGQVEATTVEFDNLSGTGAVSVTNILDEDNMASDSATALATQQSIKAYVDSQVGTVDTLAEILAIGNTTGATDIAVDSAQKVQFRDAAIYINSSVDGQLDIVADTEIQIAATTIDVNGALDVSGTALVTGVLTTTAATVSNGGGQFNGAINVGVDDTGYDVKFFGATTGKSLLWDESADSLIVTGTTTLVGTTNLDAVDIDGATQIDATVTVGVDDTGYDVKFFGATAGAYMLWDESADDLILGGAAGLSVNSAALVTGVLTTTAATVFNGGFASNAASTIATTDNSVNLTLTSTDADDSGGPKMNFYRNSASPAAGDILTQIGHQGKNDAGETVSYMYQNWRAAAVGDGAESGQFDINTYTAGTAYERLGIDPTETVFNQDHADLDFRVESDTITHALFVQGSDGFVGIGTSSPSAPLEVNQGATSSPLAFKIIGSSSPGMQIVEDTGVTAHFVNDSSAVYAGSTTSHPFVLRTNNTARMTLDSSGGLITTPAAGGHAVFNEDGIDADFRVESDSNTHALFVDAGNDQVVVGDSGNYSSKFTVVGSKTISGGIPLNQLSVYDNSAMAANTGGAITLWGNYTTGGAQAEGASIEAVKANGTTGNYQYGIWLKSRTHGGAMDSRLYMDQAQTIFNESGFDTDFRVESDGNANMLSVDAGLNTVQLGTTLTFGGAVNCTSGGIGIGESGTASYYRRVYWNEANNEMRFWNGVNEARISDGGAFVDASDESIKKDIADIEYGIDTVKSLKPRKYKLKSSDVEQVGFIAQEMEVHVPEVVFTGITPDGNEQKGIAYGQLTAVLTKAIQEQQTLIEALTARITALENA
jgi:hypothetical protein